MTGRSHLTLMLVRIALAPGMLLCAVIVAAVAVLGHVEYRRDGSAAAIVAGEAGV